MVAGWVWKPKSEMNKKYVRSMDLPTKDGVRRCASRNSTKCVLRHEKRCARLFPNDGGGASFGEHDR